MKKWGFIFLFLYSHTVLSQDKYTKFIEKASVSWASDISDTLHFSNPNLSLLLRERLNKGEIKTSIIENELPVTDQKESTLQDIINRMAPGRVKQITDEKGNITSTIQEAENPLFSTFYFDSQTRDVLEVRQVLYVQSGKLQSYIPWLSPKYSVYTSWGEKLGIANAFSTGFKICRHTKKSTRKNAIFFGNTTTKISLDTAAKIKMIKQLYGYNLLEALWPNLAKNYYKIYQADSSFSISFSKLTESLLNAAVITVPVYNAEGNENTQQTKLSDQLLTASSFTSIELVQDWFYNKKSNSAYTTITHIILNALQWNNGIRKTKETAVLKIMLK